MEKASAGVHSAISRKNTSYHKLQKKIINTNKHQPSNENNESQFHIPFFVGFDIAKIAGLVEEESLRASKTYNR